MNPIMPIALMLGLPELVTTGCEGGIEIVMLSDLPEDDPVAAAVAESTPPQSARREAN